MKESEFYSKAIISASNPILKSLSEHQSTSGWQEQEIKNMYKSRTKPFLNF